MPIKIIEPKNAPKPLAPYSYAVQAGKTIYVSGMLPVGQNAETVFPGDIKAQTKYILEKIEETLSAAGACLSDVVFNQIFIKKPEYYDAFNKVYEEFFPSAAPARYCVCTDLVRPDFLVEIAATAYIKE